MSNHATLRDELEPLYLGEEWPSLAFKRAHLSKVKLLAAVAADCVRKNISRRIYVDMGARTYGSSVKWFRSHYPDGEKFEVHAFDIEDRFRAEHEKQGVKFHNLGISVRDTVLSTGNGEMKGLAERTNDSDSPLIRTVNTSRWILQNLPILDPEALIVVKLDVEGMEHEVIPELISSGAICHVDEFFLECHYSRRGWRKSDLRTKRPCTNSPDGQPVQPCLQRAECIKMFNVIRSLGVFVHDWT